MPARAMDAGTVPGSCSLAGRGLTIARQLMEMAKLAANKLECMDSKITRYPETSEFPTGTKKNRGMHGRSPAFELEYS